MTPRRATYAAFALAVIAVYLTLPPITLRTPVVSIVIAVGAVALGALGLRGGETRASRARSREPPPPPLPEASAAG